MGEVKEASDAAIASGTKEHEQAKQSQTKVIFWIVLAAAALAAFIKIWPFITTGFGNDIPESDGVGPQPAHLIAILIILAIIAWAITKDWIGWIKAVIAILIVILVINLIGPGINWTVDGFVNWFNYGDTKDPIRRVDNARVKIEDGGYAQIQASGTILLENRGTDQCMFISPETPYQVKWIGEGFILHEKGSKKIILTTTWTPNGRVYYVRIADDRVERLTISTHPVGVKGCV